MKDIIKALVILVAYCGIGPLLGMMIAKSRKAQRVVFCLMVFMPCLHPGKLTLNVDSWEFYRGHTKGFEANWIEMLGVAIIVASWVNRAKLPGWRWLAPGALLYLLWVAMSSLSLFAAHDLEFAFMAVFKFGKAVLMFLAAYHFLRDEEDLAWVMRTLAGTMVFYTLFCLKLRYVDGMFQIQGWFEHQNPMAMWVYMCGIPLLAAALHKGVGVRDFVTYIVGFGAAAMCILLSVSRAGLGALAVGAAGVLLTAWLRGPTPRVFLVTGAGAVGALLASAFAMDGMNSRLEEVSASAEKSEYDLRDILNMQSAAMLHDSSTGIGWNNFGIMNSRPHGDKYSQILEDWDESRGFRIVDENYYANPLTESLYWLLLAENGYPGFVSYLIFISATLWFALRAARWFRATLWGAVASAQVVTFGILYLHGTVERILTQTKNMSFWLLMCGLLAAMEARRRWMAKAKLPNRSSALAMTPLAARVYP